ncbi:hypothetical protein JXA48_01735 [Candidatus Woesearchaeota archaeon]|nr:hypothetical protein [Candidatus Woesearchaeota archaeon]
MVETYDTDEVERFLDEYVPTRLLDLFLDKYEIKRTPTKKAQDLRIELVNSLSDADVDWLKEICIFEGPITLYLYRSTSVVDSYVEHINEKIVENNLSSMVDLDDDALANLRDTDELSDDEPVLRRIYQKGIFRIFEYDSLGVFTYKDKKGNNKEVEFLDSCLFIHVEGTSLFFAITKNMDLADEVKDLFSSVFDIDFLILRFHDTQIKLWKEKSNRLSSCSIHILNGDDVGSERLTSRFEGNLMMSTIYRSALEVGAEVSLYAEHILDDFKLNCGINRDEGRIFFRRKVALDEVEVLTKLIEDIFEDYVELKEFPLPEELSLSDFNNERPNYYKNALSLLKLIFFDKLDGQFSSNNEKIQSILYMLDILYDKGILMKQTDFLCPQCKSFLSREDDSLVCDSCNWKGDIADVDKVQLFFFNSDDKRVVAREFGQTNLPVLSFLNDELTITRPTYNYEAIKEFNIDATETKYGIRHLNNISSALDNYYEDKNLAPNKDDIQDLTEIICSILGVTPNPHGPAEITDAEGYLHIDDKRVLTSFVLKSMRDSSSNTDFSRTIIRQVARCVSDSESEIVVVASPKPVLEQTRAECNRLCHRAKKQFIYLDKQMLLKIFVKYHHSCSKCSYCSLGNELCADCQAEITKKENIEKLTKKLKTLEYDVKQHPHKRAELEQTKKELEELQNGLAI